MIFFTLLRISSHNIPVTDSRIPIMTKSAMDQSTSWVNCMATSGISNKIAIPEKIRMTLLFFISCIVYLFLPLPKINKNVPSGKAGC